MEQIKRLVSLLCFLSKRMSNQGTATLWTLCDFFKFCPVKKKPWSNLTRIPIAVIMFTIKKSTSQKKVVVGMSKHNCTDYSNNSMLMPKEQEVFPSDFLRSKNAVIANTLIKGHQKSSMWKYMFAKLTLWPTVKNQH